MIRVASLKDMVQVKYNKKDISGMTPAEQLAAINERTHLFVKDQYDIFNRSLIPASKKKAYTSYPTMKILVRNSPNM